MCSTVFRLIFIRKYIVMRKKITLKQKIYTHVRGIHFKLANGDHKNCFCVLGILKE